MTHPLYEVEGEATPTQVKLLRQLLAQLNYSPYSYQTVKRSTARKRIRYLLKKLS